SSGPIDLAAAREELSRAVSTAVDSRTGSIAITISAPSPPVAQRAATLLIEEVDALTQQVRRTQARRRREFVETRVSLAAHALQAAEEDQVAFRRGNASVQAPQLVLEERRRQRAVDMAQDVYVALLRDREEALQEEARNVSSLNVIVAPDLPFKKSSPSGLLLGLASILGMSTLAVLITLLAIRRRTPRDSWPPANAVRLMAAAFRNH
ncbi:MAG: hypothetical protein JWM95_3584, partial [Gemmatimonadetes bacterium]|nr:hypothetical protein [Gemmatimonadota bacterium]